jgi:RHS repeat-associated protein
MQAYTLGNGQTVTRTFDANYRVTDIVSPALELHFSLDAMGNITGVSESGGGTAQYLYDPLYRLTGVQDATGNPVEAYTYNLTGDRLSKAAPGTATGTYGYQTDTHRLTSIGTASRTYDANGNTTGNAAAGQAWGYGYNGRNRMTVVQQNGATVGTYLYNANGERVQKTVGSASTRFVYDEGSQLLSELGGTNARDYIAVGGVPLAVADGASLGFITADGLGSPRVVTSAAGAVLWSWPYAANPFGEAEPVSATGYVLNLRFPGQYQDDEAGLKYNVNRTFDAATGRYLQSDPAGLAAGLDTYGYVSGSPLIASDVLGLAASGTVNGNGLTLNIPIVYVGQGRSSWNSAIENRWSGVFGGVTVTTVVTQGNAMSVDTNLITVVAPGTRSNVSWHKNGGARDIGKWASDASDDVVSHEAGHLLHLPDRYHDVPDPTNPFGVRSIPDAGYENDIMSTSRMRPSEADFFHIMNDKTICH